MKSKEQTMLPRTLFATACLLVCMTGCGNSARDITTARVKEFCSHHGGIKEDATDEGEERAGFFTVNCKDNADVTGKDADPEGLIYTDANGHMIDQ